MGWGFVAEHPDFAERCEQLGIVFVGPDSSVMRVLGDKISAKRLAEECGVPVAPWSGGAVDTVDEARHHAAGIGFPLMIKATAGGGGRGIRRVDGPTDLDAAFHHARDEARAAFGDPTVFLERLVEGARHVDSKSESLPAYCKRCEFLRDCWGECPKNRLLRTPDGEPGLNYLCAGLKRFFAHASPTAEKLAAQLRAQPVAPELRM